MNHAYLIITHKDFNILEKLIRLIDDPRNDIFIHIDKKVCDFDKQKFLSITSYSKIFFVDNFNIYWGEYSQIQAEISLFEFAYNNGNYRYFHLISGSDMVLKSQDWIHNFFYENDGYEFLACANSDYVKKNNIVNIFDKFYHIEKVFVVKKIYMKILNRIRSRYHNDFDISFGGNWASVTNEFVKYILDNKGWIKKYFSYSHTCDEVYKQCLAINSKFKTKLYKNKENIFLDLEKNNSMSFNLRYIDWSLGGSHPKTFTLEDYDNLRDSNCIFARKFSTEVDRDVIDKIYNNLKD